MTGNTILITILFIIVVGIFGYVAFTQNSEEFPGATPQKGGGGGSMAPDFTLSDHNGRQVSLSDSEGKVRVINSWATWCPFCVDELVDFAELQQEFGNEIVVIAINRREQLDRTQSFVEDLGIANSMTFLIDPRDSFYASIGAFSMPETIFVDGSGEIVFHKRGPLPLSEMRNKVNKILTDNK